MSRPRLAGRALSWTSFQPAQPPATTAALPCGNPSQQPNKAGQMISICPLQSAEEVIDTIRQMMSRICQQSLWMTKTAHLFPPPPHLFPPNLKKKTPLQQARKIESQETLLIFVPCILALTFLNRSSGYKGPEQQLLCAKMWLKAFWKVEERDWIGYCI